MPRLTVKIVKPNFQALQKQIDQRSQEVGQALIDMSQEVAEYMANYVETHTKRKPSTGKLAKSIRSGNFVTYTKGGMEIGIGPKNKLPKYWYVVNYGGYTPPWAYGSFAGDRPSRVSNRQNQRWGKGKFFIKPKRAIRPMGYIRATINHFKGKWNRVAKPK